MPVIDVINSASGIATAVGVGLAAFQLYLSLRQAETAFADTLTERYQRITERLPLAALLGEEISPKELESELRSFHDYFELCNEQTFLSGDVPNSRRRIPRDMWSEWRDGIKQNMQRPAFRAAWASIRSMDQNGDNFSNLSFAFPIAFPAELALTPSPKPSPRIEAINS